MSERSRPYSRHAFERLSVCLHHVHAYRWEPQPYGHDFEPTSYESCRWAAQQHANRERADFGIYRGELGGELWFYRRLPLFREGPDARCEVVRPG